MIVHIAISEKFLPPFIDLVDTHFDINHHLFAFITSEKYEFGLRPNDSVKFYHTDDDFVEIENILIRAESIVLHGIWRDKINAIFRKHPELLKKTLWFMWGAEFYYPQQYDDNHRFVIQNASVLVSGVKGDIDFIRNEYGATGAFVEGMVYAKFNDVPPVPYNRFKPKSTILLGNSADPSNQHKIALTKLFSHINAIDKLYLPLSYPNRADYVAEVIAFGARYFGEAFVPLTDYIELNSYLAFLKHIDIAIFNHNRQQAINNILFLLRLGKKVYLPSTVTTYKELVQKGFCIFDIEDFDTSPMSDSQIQHNLSLMDSLYSENATVNVLRSLFEKY